MSKQLSWITPERQNVQKFESGRLAFPICRNLEFNSPSGFKPADMRLSYTIVRFNESSRHGFTPKTQFCRVLILNDVLERIIDEALIGKLPVQNKITVPEILSNPTVEAPPVLLFPFPISEPPPEPLAVIFPLIIIRFVTVETPSSSVRRVPKPEPPPELLAVIFPVIIVRFVTVEVLP
jgi:hypothetical protein